MRITITATPDAGMPLPSVFEFDLAAGGLESPDKLTINGQRNTQPFFGLRSPSAKYRDRQNARTTVSFDITRLHDTTADAQAYMLLHQSTIPGSGTVAFYAQDNKKYIMENSVVETMHQSHIGRTTKHSYQLTGGQISEG